MSIHSITLNNPIIQQLIQQKGDDKLAVEGRFAQWRVRDILSLQEHDPVVHDVQARFLERVSQRLNSLAEGQAVRPASVQVLLEDLTVVSADYGIPQQAW